MVDPAVGVVVVVFGGQYLQKVIFSWRIFISLCFKYFEDADSDVLLLIVHAVSRRFINHS